VFVVDPDLPIEVDGERLCQLYGLTRVESNLARLIAEGRTVEEAAAALRIAVNTARAYLKRVFDKTGVRRQAELVRLLLAGPAQLRTC
jgi:DNA-binding CsgD family transcriptional regulator